MADDTSVSVEVLKDLGDKLANLLRLRTLPFAMKLFEDEAAVASIPKVRRPAPEKKFTLCQLVTQCRIGGMTLAVTASNLRDNCASIPGLRSPPEEQFSGRAMTGVWFDNVVAAAAHQQQMPRVAAGRFQVLVMSPLRSERLADPDIVLFHATPAQAILFVNGLQHRSYERFDFTITGESACADSWGRALSTGRTSLSIPCFAERRYGGVADDELLLAMKPGELARGISGLEGLSAVGLRYPILPYGATQDPAEGMAVSYPARK